MTTFVTLSMTLVFSVPRFPLLKDMYIINTDPRVVVRINEVIQLSPSKVSASSPLIIIIVFVVLGGDNAEKLEEALGGDPGSAPGQ